jgi:predicted alpha/beta-hydrolase family hydrolase
VHGSASPVTLVLGHGAGGGVESADLQAVASAVASSGRRVVLVEQPWRVAGRRIAPPPATLDAAWCDVVEALRLGARVLGGRSAGARVACRTAERLGASAVVALAFPLHPPGRPERSRADELRGAAGRPRIVIQGTRDPFGTADEVRRAARGLSVLAVPGADHSLRPGSNGALAALDRATARVLALLERLERE